MATMMSAARARVCTLYKLGNNRGTLGAVAMVEHRPDTQNNVRECLGFGNQSKSAIK